MSGGTRPVLVKTVLDARMDYRDRPTHALYFSLAWLGFSCMITVEFETTMEIIAPRDDMQWEQLRQYESACFTP